MSMKDRTKNKTFSTFEELIALLPPELQERLEKLKANPERTDYHPEGNTYDHIEIVTERLMTTGDIDLIIAGLFHDMFKLETTRLNPKNGQLCAFGHEKGSAKLVLIHSDFIRKMGGDVDIVYGIVNNHMRIKQYNKMKQIKQQKLDELPYIKKLKVFALADSMLIEWDVNKINKMLEN